MDHLASRDVARLLEHGRAFERPDMWSRPLAVDRLLESVADLVPGDIAVITVTTEDLSFRTYATDEALATRRNGAVDLWARCVVDREHPVINHHTETDDRRAVMVSDFVNQVTLRRTTLFDYFWRPFAIQRAMGARVETRTGSVDLASYRSGPDFSERDRMMLNALTEHARRLLQRSDAGELATACRAHFGLTNREAEILAWAIRGWTVGAIASLLVLSPATVKAHLHNIYRKTGWQSRAVATAEVYRMTGLDKGAAETHGRSPSLTPREQDAMRAVARGWTNAQIAAGLRVSLETAKTHLRHAYRKLGARNRPDAVARFLATGRPTIT